MTENRFTEVTHESWFSRLGGAIKGVLIGTALFIAAFPLLFLNEGRAVKTYRSLKEGASSVVAVSPDEVKSANSGKLVHVAGKATTDERLTDRAFTLSVNAIHLRRVVEGYQWKESSERRTEKKLGGGTDTATTYTYTKVWTQRPIDSSQFKHPEGHENPQNFAYTTSEWTAKDVRLGAFQLGESLVRRMDQYTRFAINDAALGSPAVAAGFRATNGGFYRGTASASPEIGDQRVFFEQVEPGMVSVVAKQSGTMLGPYPTMAGGSIELLAAGTVAADAMFQAAQRSNGILTWIVRLLGLVVMFIGLSMVLRPLSVLVDVLPFLGSFVAAGTGMVALIAAGVLSFLTIAVAWIFYRPVLAVSLIAAAAGLAFALKSLRARKRAGQPLPQPSALPAAAAPPRPRDDEAAAA